MIAINVTVLDKAGQNTAQILFMIAVIVVGITAWSANQITKRVIYKNAPDVY